jgi:hypothetical protein
MKRETSEPKTGTWIVRQIPADLMRQARNYVDRYFSTIVLRLRQLHDGLSGGDSLIPDMFRTRVRFGQRREHGQEVRQRIP